MTTTITEHLPALAHYAHQFGPYFAVRTGKQSVMILRETKPVMHDSFKERLGHSTSLLSVRWKTYKRGLVMTACADNIPVGPHSDVPANLTEMQAISYFLWALGY